MSTITVIFISLAIVSAEFLVPADLLAKTTKFGAAGFADQSSKIQDFLFGPAMRLAGILGDAYGLIQAIMTSTVKPLLIYRGFGMGVNRIPKIGEQISRAFGEREIKEYQEGITYGAHETRDGVSLTQQAKTQPLVSVTEIQSLKRNQAFVKLPENYPIAKIKLPIVKQFQVK